MAAFCMEIAHSPAVGHNKSVISPLVAKNLDKKLVAAAARLAFIGIICTHDLLYISGFHKSFESIEISLREVSP